MSQNTTQQPQQISCYALEDQRSCQSRTDPSSGNIICIWQCSRTVDNNDIDCRCIVSTAGDTNSATATIALSIFAAFAVAVLIFLVIRCFKNRKSTAESLAEALKPSDEELEKRRLEEEYFFILRQQRKERIDESNRRASSATVSVGITGELQRSQHEQQYEHHPQISPMHTQRTILNISTSTDTHRSSLKPFLTETNNNNIDNVDVSEMKPILNISPSPLTRRMSADPHNKNNNNNYHEQIGVPLISITSTSPYRETNQILPHHQVSSSLPPAHLLSFEAFREHKKEVEAAKKTENAENGINKNNLLPPTAVRLIRRPPGSFAIRIRCMSKDERRASLEVGKARLNLRRSSHRAGNDDDPDYYNLTFEEQVELEKKKIREEREREKLAKKAALERDANGEPTLAQFVPILRTIAEDIREKFRKKREEEEREREARKNDDDPEQKLRRDEETTHPVVVQLEKSQSQFLDVPLIKDKNAQSLSL